MAPTVTDAAGQADASGSAAANGTNGAAASSRPNAHPDAGVQADASAQAGTSAQAGSSGQAGATTRTVTELADGRELIYYDRGTPPTGRAVADLRPLDAAAPSSEVRQDPMTGAWVTVAAHRQARTYHPPADECPLCPSREGRLSEIPADDYQVAVFENRFPSLAGDPGTHPVPLALDDPLHGRGPGVGRCEVVCFTADHEASFADLDEDRARLVLDAWTDRTAELSALPGVRQVYCFENRGTEIGVTLAHPHGQVYALPFVPPRTAKMIDQAARYRAATGRNLFDDLVAAERASAGQPSAEHPERPEHPDGSRVVLAGEYWTAFVPFAARWPYEVHLFPNRRVPDFTGLNEDERAEFPRIYLDLLRRFDRLFSDENRKVRAPYIAAWHQAPNGHEDELALHLELFTVRRTADKLKYLAGTESGMEAFMNDVAPESAARRLREVGSTTPAAEAAPVTPAAPTTPAAPATKTTDEEPQR
ncbi:UDPglucose--hexose-1-phosphate uridylyltransferase [Streptomyces sp. TLI_053]|uniref:galactose-1-phosphate uridylyltransferase n=1 Tax=Streptomyces sp. TLI_053 TaxID=1855352 RepID=UPI0008795154|nr:galactose-1-phosphate uridylyltransferase [Streptomyces sp. TLI_053]SDT81062.1 UDPglucose--hexose-1-phosphate uridylyltransferase [Streptomyces sp. TLI_053]